MSADRVLDPAGGRPAGGLARAVFAAVALLAIGAAAGFVGRLLWPRPRREAQ